MKATRASRRDHFTAACDRYLEIRRPDRKPGAVTVGCVVAVGYVIKVRV